MSASQQDPDQPSGTRTGTNSLDGPETDSNTGIRPQSTGGLDLKAQPSSPGLMPRYRVLLHNDDIHAIHQVVAWLTELTPLAYARAAEVTLEADVRGVSLVLVTHMELAELYRDQLRTRRLTVTIEPEN
jgi:ATP-dependent Clp protease adaptor protein ClpS